MTLLNVFVERERILIGTDTAAELPASERANCERLRISKCFALPATSTALALRGSAVFGVSVFAAAQLSGLAFDDLIDRFGAALEATFEQCAQHVLGTYRATLPAKQQIVVAGYSDRRKAMAAFAFTQNDLAEGFETCEITTAALAPAMPDFDAASLSTENGHIEAARAQVAWARANFPDAAFGGALILTNLTRFSVSSQRVMDLDLDYDLSLAEFKR